MKTTKSDFPAFLQGYLTAALWSSTISDPEDAKTEKDGDPFDRHFSTDDFDPEALEDLTTHARSFWLRMWFYIDAEKESPHGRTPESAGHDFWLTQNRHGAGFWDGDWPTYGDQFTKLAHCYPELSLYVTEDGMVGVG